jgi:hypothetical protein
MLVKLRVKEMSYTQLEGFVGRIACYLENLSDPEFRLCHAVPTAEYPSHWVAVEARDIPAGQYMWMTTLRGAKWRGVNYESLDGETAATQEAVQNCLSALNLMGITFYVPAETEDE